MASGLLKPLGHPAYNGQKYFLAAALEDLRRDEKWYGKASDAIVEYWRYKNSRKGQGTTANERQSRQGDEVFAVEGAPGAEEYAVALFHVLFHVVNMNQLDSSPF